MKINLKEKLFFSEYRIFMDLRLHFLHRKIHVIHVTLDSRVEISW
jgi:hypothetical protein